jgi:hypothetical protein
MTKPLALTTALALTLASCATPPATPDKATTATAAKPPAGCVAQTASRIPVKDDACAGFGNAYSKQDIDNTGQVYADKALGMLDPSVHVGH